MKGVDADYAFIKKAICYGFVAKKWKIEELNSLQSKIKLSWRCHVRIGKHVCCKRKQDLALKTFDRLISEFKNGSYTAKSILRQGLIYYNSDRNADALTKFKK
jgi:hypothetical protein